MSERKERILTCDTCGHEDTINDGSMHLGGHPFNKYYTVIKSNNRSKKIYHFCSVKCLQEYKFQEE